MTLRAWTAAVMTLAVASAAPADTFKFSGPGSKIEFVGTKKDGMHTGGFRKFTGTIDAPDGDFAKAKLTVEIDTNSIYTDNEKLTQHLKSPDFFDVRTHPKATFTATMIRPVRGDGATTHLVTGDLTLHGVKKSLTIPVQVGPSDRGLGLTATFTIRRKDFDMTFGEGQVNNDVTVKLSIQAGK
ncbi:MAG TPA: YceI family protein [Gemmataceae bacterium]|jgi:polyisoprenoid-binding protein YceI